MAIATTHTQRFPGRRPAAPRRKMGTWKMAYADFLTALMAFFLMLWLVSGVSPDSRSMIADYFTGKDTAAANGPLVEIRQSETFRLYETLRTDESLAAAGNNLQLIQAPDGIRLNLADTDARPLFASESGALTEAGEADPRIHVQRQHRAEEARQIGDEGQKRQHDDQRHEARKHQDADRVQADDV